LWFDILETPLNPVFQDGIIKLPSKRVELLSCCFQEKKQEHGKDRKGLDSHDDPAHDQAGRQAGRITVSFLAELNTTFVMDNRRILTG